MTASAITQVYDKAMNPANKKKLEKMMRWEQRETFLNYKVDFSK